MSFALSGWMLYMMWFVLGAIGLNLLAGIFKAFMNNSFSLSRLPNFLTGILMSVFPLFLLANMMHLDPFGWFIQGAYFIGGVGVFFKYIFDIKNKLM